MNRSGALDASAGLAEARWALSSSTARGVLRRELGALLEDGCSLGPCRLRRSKLKPGRKLSAYYDVEVRGWNRDALVRAVAVTWEAAGNSGLRSKGDGMVATKEEAILRGTAGPFKSLQAELPPWGMRILVSPLDECFPQLARLCDPSYAASAIPGTARRTPAVTTIRYRPGQRHVLRFDFPEGPGGGARAVVAKLYSDDQGRHAFEAADRAASLLGARAGAAALRPLAYLPHDRTLLVGAVEGQPLSGPPAKTGHLRSAGALLRALHCPSGEIGVELPGHDLDRELRATARACEHIERLLPPTGRAIVALLRRAEEVYRRLPVEAPTFVHCDFKLDHLWIGPGGLSVIDFDGARLADPAIDVGKLLADLRWWEELKRLPAQPAQRAFLEGYAGPPARLQRARVWEAVLLVKIAARRVPVVDPLWQARVRRLVARAEALMGRAASRSAAEG